MLEDCDGTLSAEGIPRLPWGRAGGMGFWGRCGPLLPFFLCFLVRAAGLGLRRGFLCCCCCWWYMRRLTSPRRKLSWASNKGRTVGEQPGNKVTVIETGSIVGTVGRQWYNKKGINTLTAKNQVIQSHLLNVEILSINDHVHFTQCHAKHSCNWAWC